MITLQTRRGATFTEGNTLDLFEVVAKRRSIRKFQPKPVATEDLRRILEAGRLAPSGDNSQPWYFVFVRHPETRKALAMAADNQMFVADADTVIAPLK